jgi:uncharacterized protein
MRASLLPVLQQREVEGLDGYKPSLYNLFVDKGETVWAINFRSMALMRFSREHYQHATRILDGEPVPGEADHLQSLREDLIRGKFLIPRSLDEIELLRTKNWSNRFGDNGLTLIIAPTLRCNFACEYCYVDLNANKMKVEDRVKLGKFFDRKLIENKPASIVWTGGDPSLAMDAVEDLSLRFLDSCARKNSEYKASLITNGFLLHDKMRKHLRSSKIESLQISLDGSQPFHDNSRYLPNRTPTYDTILKNVEDTCDDFRIFLRINVDAVNHSRIPDLLDDLEARGLTQRLYIYFAHVDDVNENSASYQSNCLTAQEYAQVEVPLLRDAMGRGFRIGGRVMGKPVFTFCGANSLNYYVVDSKVNLLKCYHDFGAADTKGIGHIGNDGSEIVTNPYNLMKWLGWDPFKIDECRDCKVLPLCMGGCSHKIVNSGMNIEKGCIKLRFSMEEIVNLFAENVTAQRGSMSSGCSSCAETAMSNV